MLSLAEELDLLREENRQLKKMLTVESNVSFGPHIRGQKARFLAVLMKHERAARDVVYYALYGSDPIGDQPDERILDVMLCKTRKALKDYGVEIKTIHNVGWYLPPESKAKLKELAA